MQRKLAEAVPAERSAVKPVDFPLVSRGLRARDVPYAMPRKPNYNFEKRQKELARQQKRDAKRQEKRDRKQTEREPESESPPPDPAAPPPQSAE
jgi:hypothetical protein